MPLLCLDTVPAVSSCPHACQRVREGGEENDFVELTQADQSKHLHAVIEVPGAILQGSCSIPLLCYRKRK